MQELFRLLDKLGVVSARFDVTLMRGLDYYTGTVFEVFDTDPENNRSLFGGGRYDGLVGMFGVEPVSAVGFAPGLTTTELFLRTHNLLPELSISSSVYIVSIGDVAEQALLLASDLRAAGISVEADVTGRKLEKQLKTATKKQVTYAVFVGEDEVASNAFTVKNLQSGEAQTVARDEIAAILA